MVDVVDPSPSSPFAFRPQHFTTPLLVATHACVPPTARRTAASSLAAPAPSAFDGTGVRRVVVVPSESCPPNPLNPQHVTLASASNAHEKYVPSATTDALVIPETSSGCALFCGDAPYPSWPYALLPQHLTEPSLSRAHEWSAPHAIVFAVVTFTTYVRCALSFHVPSPSWPLSFSPQHAACPPTSTAQVCAPPAAMSVAVDTPETSEGESRSTSSPSPSRPSSPFPQHITAPPSSNAHECSSPSATSVAFAIPETALGLELSFPDPSPSRPAPFEPQQYTVPSVSAAHECSSPSDRRAPLAPPAETSSATSGTATSHATRRGIARSHPEGGATATPPRGEGGGGARNPMTPCAVMTSVAFVTTRVLCDVSRLINRSTGSA